MDKLSNALAKLNKLVLTSSSSQSQIPSLLDSISNFINSSVSKFEESDKPVESKEVAVATTAANDELTVLPTDLMYIILSYLMANEIVVCVKNAYCPKWIMSFGTNLQLFMMY